MEVAAILAIGEFLWKIWKDLQRETINAERNSALDTGYKKHAHVHQVMCHIIDGKKLCYEEKECLKDELNLIIKEQVQVMNESGMFAKEN